MKKILCLCMAGISALMGLTGCVSAPADTTAPATTEAVVTQPPEEAKVFKVLLIGQSLGQDTVWMLQKVLRTEMPDKEFLVADIYESIALGDHVNNIKNNASIYHYYKFTDAGFDHMEGVSIYQALKDEMWDLIIFNDIVLIAMHEVISAKSKIHVVLDLQVLRIGQVLNESDSMLDVLMSTVSSNFPNSMKYVLFA